MTRRRAGLGALLAVLLAGSALVTVLVRDGGECRELGRLDRQPENSVTEHGCSNTFLVRGAGQDFVVLLGEANHLPGEPVEYDGRARVFTGLHGERYDVLGQSLGPPSSGPMWRCPARLSGGRVVLDVDSSADAAAIAGACRQARQPAPAG